MAASQENNNGTTTTTFTLSFGGIEFCLSPSSSSFGSHRPSNYDDDSVDDDAGGRAGVMMMSVAKIRDGDLIRLDAVAGTLAALVEAAAWAARPVAEIDAAQAEDNAHDLGRELFGGMRRTVRSAEEGAITWL